MSWTTESNLDLSGWRGIFTSDLTWIGLVLAVIALGLAAHMGRQQGRRTSFTPQSAGMVVLSVVLLAFAVFTNLRGTIINNLWWVFGVTTFATCFGLAVAAWADGIKGERVAKALIFLPMAISLVGASIIWRFMYTPRDPSKEQTGVMNAFWVWLGDKTSGNSDLGIGIFEWEFFSLPGRAVAVLVFLVLAALLIYAALRSYRRDGLAGLIGYGLAALVPLYLVGRILFDGGIGGLQEPLPPGPTIQFRESGPFNNWWLMVVMLWIETGFAMVILSAAIKAVPQEYIEAAKIDGADDTQVFWRIVVPQIAPTIGVVVTTLIVRVTKVFDIVKVMTNGNFDTNVLANEMINQSFQFANPGTGSTLAVLLFLSVLPVMVLNVDAHATGGGLMAVADLGSSQAGWVSRIYEALRRVPLWLIVLLWTLPTFSLLVNSFRTRNAQRDTGFWRIPTNGVDADPASGTEAAKSVDVGPVSAEQLTLENYETVFDASATADLFQSLVNSAGISIPATIIPIAFACFAAYGFAWIDFAGRKQLFIFTVALLAIPLPGGTAAPAPALHRRGPLHLAAPRQDHHADSGLRSQRFADRGLADPHRVRHAVRHLPAPQLHHGAPTRHLRERPDRWGGSLRHLLAIGAPALDTGAGRLRHLPVPVDLERLSRCCHDDRAEPGGISDHDPNRQPGW